MWQRAARLDAEYTMPMAPPKPRTITVDGMTRTIILERKRVKHVNARLRDETLAVSTHGAAMANNATATNSDSDERLAGS